MDSPRKLAENSAALVSTQDITHPAVMAFTSDLAAEIVGGRPVRIFFDNDGTVFAPAKNSDELKMDPACFAALVRLTRWPNVRATSITGRDCKFASEQMLMPGYEVRDRTGAIVAPAGDKRLHFDVIGSHGAEYLTRDGCRNRHEFDPPINAFIARFQAAADALCERYPGLALDGAKHGSVCFDLRLLRTAYNEAATAAKSLLQDYALADNNPRHATGERIFKAYGFELRPTGFGKAFGIATFGQADRAATTLFLCDRLDPDGNDVDAAILINDKNEFARGHVIKIANGYNQRPPMDAPHAAEFEFATPKDLGEFLYGVAEAVEEKLLPQLGVHAAHKNAYQPRVF